MEYARSKMGCRRLAVYGDVDHRATVADALKRTRETAYQRAGPAWIEFGLLIPGKIIRRTGVVHYNTRIGGILADTQPMAADDPVRTNTMVCPVAYVSRDYYSSSSAFDYAASSKIVNVHATCIFY